MGISDVLGILSKLRGKRVFHPRGVGYTAHVSMNVAGALLFRMKKGQTYNATVRFSRAIGLPLFMPDLHGVALRIHLDGGSYQDILMVTSGSGVYTKFLFRPVMTFVDHAYSTGLPYRVNKKLGLFGVVMKPQTDGQTGAYQDLEHAREQGAGFHLVYAPKNGTWQELGRFFLDDVLSYEETENLTYNPWHTQKHIVPAGWINRIRLKAYQKSQAARPRL